MIMRFAALQKWIQATWPLIPDNQIPVIKTRVPNGTLAYDKQIAERYQGATWILSAYVLQFSAAL